MGTFGWQGIGRGARVAVVAQSEESTMAAGSAVWEGCGDGVQDGLRTRWLETVAWAAVAESRDLAMGGDFILRMVLCGMVAPHGLRTRVCRCIGEEGAGLAGR